MRIRHGALLASAAALMVGCSEPTVPDFNNPSSSDYQIIQNRSQLQAQATGLINGDRFTHDFQILLDETIARDVYRLDGAESRYITQTLGASISPSVFIGTSVFTGPYRTINTADVLIRGVQSAAPGANLDAAEVAATVGYAQTIKALQYMRLIEQRDTLGIPLLSTEFENLSPILCKAAVLTYTSALLDSAATQLAAGGDGFPFELPPGFDGFETPDTFAQFNRALAAKVEIYRAFANYSQTAGDSAGARGRIDQAALTRAQAALNASFLDGAGDLDVGVYHTYSLAAGDYSNPNFDPSVYRINPRVVAESEGATVTVTGSDTVYTAVDRRVLAKVQAYSASACKSVRSAKSCYRDNVNESPTAPIAIIKNVELYLLQAEIFWGQGNFPAALAIVNDVRSRRGGFTTPLSGLTDRQVLRAILREKRVELLFESASRYVDFRMFGLLAELGKERATPASGDTPAFAGYDAVAVFPFPVAERLARGGNLTPVCQ